MKYKPSDFIVEVASKQHAPYAAQISTEIESSAKARGTGIAKRPVEYIIRKMEEGKAIIATHRDGTWAGFCYIESWGHEKFVANSGLIVSPVFREAGLAKEIKKKAFELSRKKYPTAKIFGLTTSLAVMRINSELGYSPVTFSELTNDEDFWKGCQSCVNYDVLSRTNRKNCLCTGMMFDPNQKAKKSAWKPFNVYERWMHFKEFVLLKFRKTIAVKKTQQAAPVATPAPEPEKILV